MSNQTGVWEIELCESHWATMSQATVEVSSEQLHVFFAEHVMIAFHGQKAKG